MHPTIGDRLNQDHLTGLRRHAQRTALARAARAEERTFTSWGGSGPPTSIQGDTMITSGSARQWHSVRRLAAALGSLGAVGAMVLTMAGAAGAATGPPVGSAGQSGYQIDGGAFRFAHGMLFARDGGGFASTQAGVRYQNCPNACRAGLADCPVRVTVFGFGSSA
jgi:hypothetical protein